MEGNCTSALFTMTAFHLESIQDENEKKNTPDSWPEWVTIIISFKQTGKQQNSFQNIN